jgi:hypothetical protein
VVEVVLLIGAKTVAVVVSLVSVIVGVVSAVPVVSVTVWTLVVVAVAVMLTVVVVVLTLVTVSLVTVVVEVTSPQVGYDPTTVPFGKHVQLSATPWYNEPHPTIQLASVTRSVQLSTYSSPAGKLS